MGGKPAAKARSKSVLPGLFRNLLGGIGLVAIIDDAVGLRSSLSDWIECWKSTFDRRWDLLLGWFEPWWIAIRSAEAQVLNRPGSDGGSGVWFSSPGWGGLVVSVER